MKSVIAACLPTFTALGELTLRTLEVCVTTFQMNHALSEGRVEEPGIIVIRGARQYGKSTWLQRMIEQTVTSFGGGTAFYLNGDEIRDHDDLREEIRTLLLLFQNPRSHFATYDGTRGSAGHCGRITSMPSGASTLSVRSRQSTRTSPRGVGTVTW